MTAILLALIIYGQVIWESIHEGAMARLWPGGLDAQVARLSAAYAGEVALLEGLLARPRGQ